MKKQDAFIVMLVSAFICIAAGAAWHLGHIPQWAGVILLIIAFPVFVVFLGLWWNASEGEGDIPFLGY